MLAQQQRGMQNIGELQVKSEALLKILVGLNPHKTDESKMKKLIWKVLTKWKFNIIDIRCVVFLTQKLIGIREMNSSVYFDRIISIEQRFAHKLIQYE